MSSLLIYLHVAKACDQTTADRNWVSISKYLVIAYQFSTYVPNSLPYHSRPRYPWGHCPAICHKDCKHHARDGRRRNTSCWKTANSLLL